MKKKNDLSYLAAINDTLASGAFRVICLVEEVYEWNNDETSHQNAGVEDWMGREN